MEIEAISAPERELEDPRMRKLAGWEHAVPLYQLQLAGVPRGTQCAAGTTFPAPGSAPKNAFAVHLEIPGSLTPIAGRRLMRQIYRALLAQARENQAWSAASKLGGEDHPSCLPWSKPGRKDAHCFWMMLAEFERPVLAFRTHFETKEVLKRLFNEAYKDTDPREALTRSGWKSDAKVWWISTTSATSGYSRILGRLRALGYHLRWVQRDGFPPAPPVEEAP